jgi:DNA-binding transcriptional LysR family regulator
VVARERNSAQSAVSKQVAAMERHLGTKLLIRTTRSLALTEDGERYFEATRRPIGELAENEAWLRHGQQQLSGSMRVAAPAGFGLRVMLPHVNRFLAAHPEVTIDFQLNDSFIDLIEQGIDVVVRTGALADRSLVEGKGLSCWHAAPMPIGIGGRRAPGACFSPRAGAMGWVQRQPPGGHSGTPSTGCTASRMPTADTLLSLVGHGPGRDQIGAVRIGQRTPPPALDLHAMTRMQTGLPCLRQRF